MNDLQFIYNKIKIFRFKQMYSEYYLLIYIFIIINWITYPVTVETIIRNNTNSHSTTVII